MKFPNHIMELLKELKSEQEKQAELMGSKWITTDPKDNGEPMFTGMPYKWLERLCRVISLPACFARRRKQIICDFLPGFVCFFMVPDVPEKSQVYH